jgi:hypothetical protein
LDQQICSLPQGNFNSVKHVRIHSKRAITNCVNCFPNATELTVEHCFKSTDDPISKALNGIVPLEKLTNIVFKCYGFSLKQIIKLLRSTPNLNILKLAFLSFNETDSKLIQQSQIFQYVSKTNKITNLDIRTDFTLGKIQLIVSLFPKLECLKIGMKKEEIHQIVRFLISKTNDKTRHLYFLRISRIPKRCLKELNLLIKSENLLDDYYIKFVNRDLYLWW